LGWTAVGGGGDNISGAVSGLGALLGRKICTNRVSTTIDPTPVSKKNRIRANGSAGVDPAGNDCTGDNTDGSDICHRDSASVGVGQGASGWEAEAG